MSKLLQPFSLGHLTFPTNLIQGPLAGYSCSPFRKLIWQHANIAYACTEMLSAAELATRPVQPLRYLHRDQSEQRVCFQLSGHDPEMLKRATQVVMKAGADIIDLNCGCPVHKIRNKSAGSKLLQKPEKMYALLQAITQNTNLPVTVKIRVSAPLEDHNTQDVIAAAEAAGVAGIVVHGRHWTQRYDVPANLAAIQEICQMTSLPVIANGDIADRETLQRMLTETNCKAVMIARASVGDPWLFSRLQNDETASPTLKQVAKAFLQHIHGLIELEGERNAIFQSRKLAKYYARHLSGDVSEFLESATQATSLTEMEKLIHKAFH